MRIRRTLLVLLVATASLLLPPATAGGTTAPTAARLDVTISLTSDWAGVSLSPGSVMAQRFVSVPRGVTVTRHAQGWIVRSTAGVSRTVRLRAVFEERTLASRITVSLAKGRSGRAGVTLSNSSRTAFVAAQLVNTLANSGTRVVSAARTRAQFFGGSGPDLSPADPERHVLAFYYPWFQPSTYDLPTLSDRPLDRRGTVGPKDVLAHTQMARSGGIDGFIVSWAGEEINGQAFDSVLRSAEYVGGVGSVYIETVAANATLDPSKPADPAVVQRWLTEALNRAGSPAFLRSGGVPVVFVYQMSRLTPDAWKGILDALAAAGLGVRLVGDAPLIYYGGVEWGVHRYDALGNLYNLSQWNRQTMYDARLLAPYDGRGRRLFAATVSPGYDDTKLRGADRPVTLRGTDGERYLGTWTVGMTAAPDWVLVTSWNEWYEGTNVQPSETYGDRALQQTAQQAALFRASG